jgi:uridine kinase
MSKSAARRREGRGASLPSAHRIAPSVVEFLDQGSAPGEKPGVDRPRLVLQALAMTPMVVGIAGGTGSGKTTVAKTIAQALPPSRVAVIEYDAYYRDRPDLDADAIALINFDHPESLEADLLVEHLGALKRGASVDVPIYDFKTHRRLPESRRIEPAPVVLVEGILVFVDERIRASMDLKIFVDTDADIRVFRRIRRDMEKRGRTFESIRDQYYTTVRPMHLEFVEPSKRWADLIIPEGGNNTVALDLIISKLASVAAG